MAKKAKKKLKARASTSTAIARRPAGLRVVIRDPSKLLPKVIEEPSATMLADEGSTGALGLVEVKLTKREETILSEPVRQTDMQVKPTGQPYLSHPFYTRWFNRAFGRTGWSIVQKSKPMRQQREKAVTIAAYYMFYIHGKPVAWALGEAEYHEDNKEQTYGDALEATVAYALRRCAKRLGVGLELWEKPFLEQFLMTHCVKVFVTNHGERKPAWRLKSSPAFWNETGVATDRQPPSGSSGEVVDAEPARNRAPSGTHAQSGSAITEKQVKRLWAIAKSAGRSREEVNEWLGSMGFDQALEGADVLRRDYDAIVAAIEQPGKLQKLTRQR